MEISRRGDKCPGVQQPVVLDRCTPGHWSARTLFLRILQAGPAFFIEIKCSALNLKYLSQYLNGFGCPLLVPLNFQNLIFGLLYSYWHIIIIAPLFPTLKLFFLSKTYIWPAVFFFLKFKNQTLVYNTLISYVQLWFYNHRGWLNKGKTHFISLFPFKLNNASRKFFFT